MSSPSGHISDIEAAFAASAPGIKRAAVIGGLASASGIALTATSGWLIVAASHQPVILTLLAVIVAVRTFGIARPVLRYAERVRSHDSALDLLARRGSRHTRRSSLSPPHGWADGPAPASSRRRSRISRTSSSRRCASLCRSSGSLSRPP